MKTLFLKSVILSFSALAVATVAIAKDGDKKVLDASAVKALISNHILKSKQVTAGSGYNYWAWKSDGSVCMRLASKKGTCDDKGRWKLDGDRLCWELEWFGNDLKLKSACVDVTDQGKGHYLATDKSGTILLDFTVLK